MILSMVARRSVLLGMLVVAATTVAYAQDGSLSGRWDGAISIQGTDIPMQVNFVEGDALTATIDTQGATGVRLENVTHVQARVHFELPAGPGRAVFDGELEGDTIRGRFTQAGYEGSFELRRAAADARSREAPAG